MRLLLVSLLISLCSCGFGQKYTVKETILYPNVFQSYKIVSDSPVEITIYGKDILVKDSSRIYVIEKEKFVRRVPMENGSHLNVYEARVGMDEIQVGFWYSRLGYFLGIQLKRGYSIVVFIIEYDKSYL